MSDPDKRSFLKALHPGSKRWARRVNAMPDAQVTAIYLREINKPPKKERDK